tara:strand:+ start:205 stop:315 length:111 start_codon:yes stop_codon:yes gene_type:complete
MKKDKIIIFEDGGHAISCIDLVESTKKFKMGSILKK